MTTTINTSHHRPSTILPPSHPFHLLILPFLLLIIATDLCTVTEAAPVARSPHQPQTRGAQPAAVASSAAASGPARPRPSARTGSSHNYTIVRPGQCRASDLIFADCFLCGKIADNPRIYTDCCERDSDIVRFCVRLLS